MANLPSHEQEQIVDVSKINLNPNNRIFITTCQKFLCRMEELVSIGPTGYPQLSSDLLAGRSLQQKPKWTFDYRKRFYLFTGIPEKPILLQRHEGGDILVGYHIEENCGSWDILTDKDIKKFKKRLNIG